MIEFTVSIPECRFPRKYKASTPRVAIKKYLNYHRRFSNIRPTKVTVTWDNHTATKGPCGYNGKVEAEVEWYRGKLEDAVLKSEFEAEWWRILKIEKK